MAQPEDSPAPSKKAKIACDDDDLLYTTMNDPIHGPMKLHPLLTKIVNTTEFSRLRHIKQLGGACYVYPGAQHTRFEHSIGVCHLAGELVRMLQQKTNPALYSIKKEDILCVEVAALCHDLGHGPFSHMFETRVAEPILGKKLKHEQLSQLIFERIYDKLKEDFSCYHLHDKEKLIIQKMIHPAGDKEMKKIDQNYAQRRFLYEIVANKTTGIDVDKWDYFERDGKYLGVPIDFQTRRLMSLTRVVNDKDENHLCYPEKELHNIYGMFHTRCTLFQKAYHHKTVKAVDQMIADAILAVKEVPLVYIPGTTDAHGYAVETIVNEAANAKNGNELDAYLALTDDLLELIKHGHRADDTHKARKLIERLEERDIYKRTFKKTHEWPKDENGKAKEIPAKDIGKDFIKGPYYIEVIDIHHGSGEKDPTEKILLYRKGSGHSGVQVLEKADVDELRSDVVIPKAFRECQICIYRKGAEVSEGQDDEMRRCLEKWCQTLVK